MIGKVLRTKVARPNSGWHAAVAVEEPPRAVEEEGVMVGKYGPDLFEQTGALRQFHARIAVNKPIGRGRGRPHHFLQAENVRIGISEILQQGGMEFSTPCIQRHHAQTHVLRLRRNPRLPGSDRSAHPRIQTPDHSQIVVIEREVEDIEILDDTTFGVTDFGMTIRPCWICQRMIVWGCGHALPQFLPGQDWSATVPGRAGSRTGCGCPDGHVPASAPSPEVRAVPPG